MAGFPFFVFVFSLAILWLSVQIAIWLRKRRGNLEEAAREDLGRVLTATLTLLGLIVGFSFSMAVTEYHQRISAEEAEASAISTGYVRAGLLPATDAARLRELLAEYLHQRILFYTTVNRKRLEQVNTSSARLHAELWSTVESAATSNPTPVIAMAVSGVNDVLNTQASTHAAWSNRIPTAAWALLEVVAVFGNLLFGYISRSNQIMAKRFVALPFIVAVSFFFIADMDYPRDGVIEVVPRNLVNLSVSMRAQ